MRWASLTMSALCSLGLLVAALPAAAVATAAVTTAATSAAAPHIMLAAKSRINAKQAAATVKKKLGGKVLSVKLIESKGPPVYRVKTLSKSGVVKVVFVDGQSGKVFN